jgi:hypothetical protein
MSTVKTSATSKHTRRRNTVTSLRTRASARIRRAGAMATLMAATGLTVTGLLVNTAPAAHAVAGDLDCTAAATIDFSQPLTATNTSAKATVSGTLVGCTSPNGMHSALTSGSVSGSGPVTSASGVNPCSLLLTITLRDDISWSNGQHSRTSALVNTNPSNGTITLESHVDSGVLAGDTDTVVTTIIPNADCATNGLKELTLDPVVTSFN